MYNSHSRCRVVCMKEGCRMHRTLHSAVTPSLAWTTTRTTTTTPSSTLSLLHGVASFLCYTGMDFPFYSFWSKNKVVVSSVMALYSTGPFSAGWIFWLWCDGPLGISTEHFYARAFFDNNNFYSV